MSKLTLAIIPARGGSKGVPNKNIRVVAGKPLIAYSIESGLKSKLISHLVVSTDSEAIAQVSKELGAKVPFMRPAELATDMAASLPVIQHAVKEMEAQLGVLFDCIVMLQATCPLRSTKDIDEAVTKFYDTGADSVISVVSVGGNHPLRMKRIVGDQLVNYIEQGVEDMRPRQVLPPTYIRNGALYITKRDIIMNENSFIGSDCRAFVMPDDRSINIDKFEDMLIAEYYLNLKND